jgi:GNAT superfamily N-acetyltransferase
MIEPVGFGPQIAEWTAIHNANVTSRPLDADYARHVWALAPDGQAMVARREGQVVGVAHVETPHWVPDSTCAEAMITVAMAERRTGVGSTLLAAVSEWAAAHDLDGLDIVVADDDADGMRFLESRDFQEVERNRQSRCDLTRPVEPVVLPDGVVLVTVAQRPDLDRGMYAVALAAFPDIPGAGIAHAGDFDHWRAGDLRVPGMLTDCSVIALARDEVVGYAVLVDLLAMPGYVVHEATAVLPEWRGKGVATAMKRDTLHRAQRSGYIAAETENEVRNAPMLAINEAAGFERLRDAITYRGPLVR